MPCQNDNKIYDVYHNLKTDIEEGDPAPVIMIFTVILLFLILSIVLIGVIREFIKVRRLAKRTE
jgi:hypothetical protein